MSGFGGNMTEYRLISIDRFDKNNLKSTVFLLSHCHRDHMVGLDHTHFLRCLQSRNNIFLYCSEVTKLLLLSEEGFKPLEPYIHVLQIEVPSTITIPDPESDEFTSVVVTALPAGHCPGSVMFLIEGKEGRVLYTGDFRWEKNYATTLPALCVNGHLKKIDSMYVDTTFCVPEAFYIPSREDCLSATASLVVAWLGQSSYRYVHVSSRTNYGHEPLLSHLAREVKTKVHTSREKVKIYEQITELRGIFTDNPSARIHACKWTENHFNDSRLPCGYTPQRESNTDGSESCEVLVIRPSTMWFTNEPSRLQELVVRPASGWGLHRVCYSFHSSYAELRDLVSLLRPRHVHPNVLPASDTHWTQVKERLQKFLAYQHKHHMASAGDCNIVRPLGLLKRRRRESVHNLPDSEGLVFDSPEKTTPKRARQGNTSKEDIPQSTQKSSTSSVISPTKSETHSSYQGSDLEEDMFADSDEEETPSVMAQGEGRAELASSQSLRSYVSGDEEVPEDDQVSSPQFRHLRSHDDLPQLCSGDGGAGNSRLDSKEKQSHTEMDLDPNSSCQTDLQSTLKECSKSDGRKYEGALFRSGDVSCKKHLTHTAHRLSQSEGNTEEERNSSDKVLAISRDGTLHKEMSPSSKHSELHEIKSSENHNCFMNSETERDSVVNRGTQMYSAGGDEKTQTCCTDGEKAQQCSAEDGKKTHICCAEDGEKTQMCSAEDGENTHICSAKDGKKTQTCSAEDGNKRPTCFIEDGKKTQTCSAVDVKKTRTCSVENGEKTQTCSVVDGEKTAGETDRANESHKESLSDHQRETNVISSDSDSDVDCKITKSFIRKQPLNPWQKFDSNLPRPPVTRPCPVHCRESFCQNRKFGNGPEIQVSGDRKDVELNKGKDDDVSLSSKHGHSNSLESKASVSETDDKMFNGNDHHESLTYALAENDNAHQFSAEDGEKNQTCSAVICKTQACTEEDGKKIQAYPKEDGKKTQTWSAVDGEKTAGETDRANESHKEFLSDRQQETNVISSDSDSDVDCKITKSFIRKQPLNPWQKIDPTSQQPPLSCPCPVHCRSVPPRHSCGQRTVFVDTGHIHKLSPTKSPDSKREHRCSSSTTERKSDPAVSATHRKRKETSIDLTVMENDVSAALTNDELTENEASVKRRITTRGERFETADFNMNSGYSCAPGDADIEDNDEEDDSSAHTGRTLPTAAHNSVSHHRPASQGSSDVIVIDDLENRHHTDASILNKSSPLSCTLNEDISSSTRTDVTPVKCKTITAGVESSCPSQFLDTKSLNKDSSKKDGRKENCAAKEVDSCASSWQPTADSEGSREGGVPADRGGEAAEESCWKGPGNLGSGETLENREEGKGEEDDSDATLPPDSPNSILPPPSPVAVISSDSDEDCHITRSFFTRPQAGSSHHPHHSLSQQPVSSYPPTCHGRETVGYPPYTCQQPSPGQCRQHSAHGAQVPSGSWPQSDRTEVKAGCASATPTLHSSVIDLTHD
ncbi:uncharacterized protein LOC143299904 [Babylonia areolata]|uniref:uncharacterized protein LOC143299904 n=1 Tax=Babylonia areolata TaxID=304850 RepID=UPI003FCFB097